VQIQHLLEIQKIITGGMGLARLDGGMVVMVPYVLPGEQVLVEETQRKRGYIQARPLDIVRPARERRRPPCPQYGHCGGCNLQHADYDAQLIVKQAMMEEMAYRAGLVPANGINIIKGSPQTEQYRYRLRLHIDRSGTIGFHQSKSNKVVPVSFCLLACQAINNTLAGLAKLDLGAFFAELELHCSPADHSVTAVLGMRKGSQQPPGDIIARIREQGALDGLALRRGRRLEPVGNWHILQQNFSLDGYGYFLQWDCRSFFQVNPLQNERLVRLVIEMAGEIHGKQVLDLYCGMGNFTIPLALAGAEVHGVEVNPHAIRAAGANAVRAGRAEQVQFTAMPVEKFVRASQRKKPDLILVDPPRQGLSGIADGVAGLGARRILYISCDPATLFRDLKIITHHGYGLLALQPVDMFPQTAHIETVALLEKN